MSPEEAQKAVDAVIETLEGRKGFDWWWETLDTETQVEIKAEARRNVLGVAE